MRMLKSGGLSRVLAEYLEKGSTDFHQTYHLLYPFKLKDRRQVILCCHGTQFMRECWAKCYDLREEKWHFLEFSK